MSAMKRSAGWTSFFSLLAALACHAACGADPKPSASPDLWEMAQSKRGVHRFSTLFTAQNVREHLSNDEGIAAAIDWCRKTAVTKVYIETFRDGYQAERETLLARQGAFPARPGSTSPAA